MAGSEADDGVNPEITEATLREADQHYVPFVPFSEWTGVPVDVGAWDARLSRLAQLRASVDPSVLERATQATLRMAAIDTGAIEGLYEVDRGFTFTVAYQKASWEEAIDERGPMVRKLFEAQLRTYELVMDLATGTAPLSEAIIRRIHEETTEPQETFVVLTPLGRQEQQLPRGQYKTQPNHPWSREGLRHAYAPVAATPSEMHRLVVELSSEDFATAHPAVQAAYAHHAFVSVHPFADGNGRVARALASIFLYRASSIPLIVFADQKTAYLDALAAADSGDYVRFIEFVFDRAVAAMTRVTDVLRANRGKDPTESLAGLRTLYDAMPGITFEELDRSLSGIRKMAESEINLEIKRLQLGHATATVTGAAHSKKSPMDGYRFAISPAVDSLDILVRTPAPANAAIARNLDFLVTTTRDRHATFVLRERTSGDTYEFGLADAHPEITPDTRGHLRTVVDGIVAGAVNELFDAAQAALRAKGY